MGTALKNLLRKINDSHVSVSELTRIAYAIMSQSDNTQTLSWINAEMNGYDRYPNMQFPEYRKITGQLKCYNPYRGWIPIIDTGENSQLMREVSSKYISLSVCELEKFVADGDGKELEIKLAKELELLLLQSLDVDFRPAIVIPTTRFVAILNSVRHKILDWALTLSENGIDAKAEAILETDENFNEKSNQTNITEYHTTVGSAESIMLQQNSPNAQQILKIKSLDTSDIINLLKETRDVLNSLDEQHKKEGTMYLDIIENEAAKDTPDESKIKTIYSYVYKLLENVSSNLIASEIVTISPLLFEHMDKIKALLQ